MMTTPDPIRAALERLATMANDELTTPGPWAHSYPDWADAIAAARAALAAAPADGPAVPEGREPAAVASEASPATTPAPAAGEGEELVAWLESHAEDCTELGRPDWTQFNRRAATLLRQLSAAPPAPQPVAISERPWKRPGWCDSNGRCWFGAPQDGAADAKWVLRRPSERLSYQTASLPASALPLPTTTPAGQEGADA